MLFRGFEQPGIVDLKGLPHPGNQAVVGDVPEVVVLAAGTHFAWEKAGIEPLLARRNPEDLLRPIRTRGISSLRWTAPESICLVQFSEQVSFEMAAR